MRGAYVDNSTTRSAATIRLIRTSTTSKDAGEGRPLEVEEEGVGGALGKGAVVGHDTIGVAGEVGSDGGDEGEADVGVFTEVTWVLFSKVLA